MRSLVAIVLLAACGDGGTAPDAAATIDAPAGLVRVRYRGSVLDGHAVFFQNADGSLALATRTGQDGTANAFMAPGGSVTLIDIKPSGQFLSTWTAVQAGDEIVVDDPEMNGGTTLTTISLSFELDPSAVIYRLHSSCGMQNLSGAVGGSLLVTLADCGGRADMLVFASGDEFHYLYAENVPVVAGGFVTLAGPYRPVEASTVAVTGVDARAPYLDVRLRLIGEHRFLFDDSSELFGFADVTLSGGSGSTGVSVLRPPGGTMLTQISEPLATGVGAHRLVHWGPPAETTTFEVGARTLRRYATRPRYAPLDHVITWTEEATGARADAVIATFGWFRPEIGGSFDWRIFAPRGAEPIVRLPVLPDPAYAVHAGDTIIQPYILTNIALDGGYDRLRTTLPSRWPARGGSTWPAEATGDAASDVVYQELGVDMPFPD